MTDDTRARRTGGARVLLAVHAGVVGVLLAAFIALSVAGGGGDANIGAGIVGLPLIALGVPWSFPAMHAFDALTADRAVAGDALMVVLYLGSRVVWAPLNVLLHWAVWRAWRRRRST